MKNLCGRRMRNEHFSHVVLESIKSSIQVYCDDSRWVVTKSHLLTLHIVLVSCVRLRG